MNNIYEKEINLRDELERLKRENAVLKNELKKYQSYKNNYDKEELLRAVMDASPLPITAMGFDSTLMKWNKAAENTFGWSEDEVLGKKNPIIPENKIAEFEQLKKRLLEGGQLTGIEIVRQRKDGTLIPLILSCAPIRSESGEITGMMNVLIDDTRKKFSHIKFRALFEIMTLGIIFQDADGKIIEANPAAENILGISTDELLGKSVFNREWKSIMEDGTTYKKEEFPSIVALSTGETVRNKIIGSYNYKEKEYRWLIITAVPLFRPGCEKPDQIYVSLEDITERKKAIESIIDAERKNNAILSAIPDTIFIFDREGICVDYKAENNIKFSIEPSLLVKKKLDDYVPLSFKQMFYERLNEAFTAGEIQTILYDLNIDKRNYHLEGRMIKYSDDEVLIIVRDITDRIAAEKKLKKDHAVLEKLVEERTLSLVESNQKLAIEIKKQKKYEMQIQEALEKEKELNELKSRFISVASHEYRTPLTTIKIFSDLLKLYGRNIDDEKYYSYIGKIHYAVDYMTELINDVLMVSKSETGKIKLEPKVLDLQKICLAVVEESNLNLKGNNRIHFNYMADLKEVYLDNRPLKQILSNLLSNAVKYSPVSANIYFNVDSNDSKIIFNVKDEGIGIPKAEQGKIFDSFHRGKNIGTTPGTGLGLTIVKRMVELINGKIYLESEVNKGTSFTIEIPII